MDRLKKMRQGRIPACSRPLVGLKSASQTSPREGAWICGVIYRHPTRPPRVDSRILRSASSCFPRLRIGLHGQNLAVQLVKKSLSTINLRQLPPGRLHQLASFLGKLLERGMGPIYPLIFAVTAMNHLFRSVSNGILICLPKSRLLGRTTKSAPRKRSIASRNLLQARISGSPSGLRSTRARSHASGRASGRALPSPCAHRRNDLRSGRGGCSACSRRYAHGCPRAKPHPTMSWRSPAIEPGAETAKARRAAPKARPRIVFRLIFIMTVPFICTLRQAPLSIESG